MLQFDLATLAGIKGWLGIAPTDISRDVQMSRLITQVSRVILSAINRSSILPKVFTETRDGHGGDAILLANYPALSVSTLTVDGVERTASSSLTSGAGQLGYVLETSSDVAPPGAMQQLFLRGFVFSRGRQNVIITYTAGYQLTELATIPALTPYQLSAMAPYGEWMADGGVKFANGTGLTAVPGAPSAGQYKADVGGNYTFAVADTGKTVSLTYGYAPADLAEICAELVGERMAYGANPGVASHRAGDTEERFLVGQPNNSSEKTMAPWVAGVLQQYTRVVPI